MAITAAMRTQVAQLYTSLFGRAPEADGLGFWVQKLNNGESFASVAQQMYSVDAARAYYPSFYTNQEIIAKFYTNVLGRTADADGLAFWTAKLDAKGATPGSVIAEMITVVAGYSGTDPDALKSQALFNNKVSVGLHYAVDLIGNDVTFAKTLFSGVTDDPATVTAANASADAAVNPPVTGKTFTLSTGADVLTGSTADDVFVGTESTLSSADVLKGGTGTDTLRVANSGAAKTFSGFELNSIENIQVTADGTGATAFDVTGTTGVTKIANSGSSQDLTFTGLKAIPTNGLEVTGVTGGNTTVTFESDAVAGAADTMKVALSGAKTITNGAIGTITANGIETFTVTTADAASNLTAIASTSLKAMTVSGDKSLTLAGVTFTDNVNVNTLNASGLTGTAALNVTISANTATLDVAVTGGNGDDRADFSTGFDTKDAFTGGAGRDTLALTQAVASAQAAATGGTVSGVEILEITNGGTGTISMDNFGGVDTVYYSGITGGTALTGNVTVSNAVTGITVRDAVDAAAQNITVTLKTNGTTDVANFAFDKVGSADNIGTLSAAEFETVNITASDDAAVLDTGSLTIANTTLTAATKVALAGDANVTISAATNPSTPVLATVDASTMTGKLNVTGLNLRAAGATVTLGSGDDVFNVGTAAGGDVFDLSKGGKDKIVYNAVAQSSATGTDTIKGFTSGNDIVDISAAALLGGGTNGAGVADSTQFVGNKATFGEAQGALAGAGSNTQSAVFDQSSGILWVDSNKDGTLDANDFRIKFEGVTSLTAADLGLAAAAGASISVTAASANVSTTLNTNATAKATAFNDTISIALANLGTATINGGTGTDTLSLSTAGAVGALSANITNVETLVLNTTGSTANTGVAFNAAGAFKTVTGSSNSDTITSTANLLETATLSLGAGNDTITALTLVDTANHAASTSTKISVDMGDGDDQVTTTTLVTWSADTSVAGGNGTDTLVLVNGSNTSAGTISGFETINLAGNATMSVAQYNAATTVAGDAVAANTLTLSDAGTFSTGAVATNVGVETFTLANGTNNVTLSGAADATRTVTGGTGADTVNTTVANAFNSVFAGGTGSDVLNITGGITGALALGTGASGAAAMQITGVERVNISGASTANVITFTSAVDGEITTIDASGVTGGGVSLNLTALASGADTATDSITLSDGDDTITGLNHDSGVAMTLDFRTGNATVSDLLTTSNGLVTMKATSTAGSTTTITFSATTANFLTGSTTNGTLLDFSGDVTAIQIRGVGTAGANTAGQVIIDNTVNGGADTQIVWDANGDGNFGVGDIKIYLTGQAYTGSTATISGGNLYL